MDHTVTRGRPLLLLGALLVGWLVSRAVLWEPPLEPPAPPPNFAEAASRLPATASSERAVPPPAPDRAWPDSPAPGSSASGGEPPVAVPQPLEHAVPPPVERPVWLDAAPAPRPTPVPVEPLPSPDRRLTARAAVGHNLLLVAGLSQMELPPALVAYLESAVPPAPGVPAAAPMLAAARPAAISTSRWSADSWLLLRDDETTPFLSGRPSYGRSQAGAVIRYELAPASPRRPQAYLRGSTALAGAHEQELAAGVSVRPLAGLPLRVAIEGRVGETDRGTRVRPAAFIVTEFPQLRLPLGMRGEAYAQGGYVGGAYSTAFVDGQARIERSLARRGAIELSAGGGAWGGAQRDAARVDVGPTATVSFRLGEARGRVAADYRFRVAGNAEPASGPALTVSAGF